MSEAEQPAIREQIDDLAARFGLNVRAMSFQGNTGYQLGERPGGAGSYGLDAVIDYDECNGRWSGRGGLTLPPDKVEQYMTEWTKTPDAHPDDLATRVGLDRYSRS